MRPVKGLAQRIQRARPDVAIHHAERQQRQARQIPSSRMGWWYGRMWVLRSYRRAHGGGTLCDRVPKGQRITKPKVPAALTMNALEPPTLWKTTPKLIPPPSDATPVRA